MLTLQDSIHHPVPHTTSPSQYPHQHPPPHFPLPS
ncbi:hypothetical protein E2C01_091348 [Portunus trituberculatus]|uniref:Uncharacterized protein n=1 Tax=Portunus trituberculatus TaxID=210409 RepID=A0A5B7JMQ5_PORTR|nr:hypothetical protein [Portunus trituberculatus]